MSEAKQVIETLFKPEARTVFPDILLQASKEYYHAIFQNPAREDIISEFAKRNGVIFPIGSTRRGTARPTTSDIDFLIVWDDANFSPFSPIGHHTAASTFDYDSNQYHPEGILFPQYLARKLKSSSNAGEKEIYENRKETFSQRLEKRVDLSDERKQEMIEENFVPTEATELEVGEMIRRVKDGGINHENSFEYWYTIHKDSIPPVEFLPFSQLNALKAQFEISKDPKERDYVASKIDTLDNTLANLRYIPYILINLPEFVVESKNGALLNLQRGLVSALLELQKNKPKEFEIAYEEVKGGFRSASFYLQSNHGITQEYYDRIIREYLEKTGRFPPEKLGRAVRIFKSVRKSLEFPPLESFAKLYGIGG